MSYLIDVHYSVCRERVVNQFHVVRVCVDRLTGMAIAIAICERGQT